MDLLEKTITFHKKKNSRATFLFMFCQNLSNQNQWIVEEAVRDIQLVALG